MLKIRTRLTGTRKVLFGFAASLMALGGMLMMPASVYAGGPSGQYELFASGGSGLLIWDQSNDFLYMESKPGPLGGSNNRCGDAIFDWTRDDNNPFNNPDHHDARIVRNCQANGFHSASIQPDSGGSLVGMQKAAYCFGTDNNTTAGVCTNAPDAQIVQGNVNVNIPNNCVRAWKKFSNGTTAFYSGGASTSCTS